MSRNRIMYTILLWGCCLATLTSQASREHGIVLTGSIKNADTGSPLEYATISLFNPVDSQLVTGGISDEEGHFRLRALKGNYLLKFEYISFQSQWINDFNLNKRTDLGDILMQSDEALLDEVEVVAERSQLQLTLEKKVFNVGQDLANSGGSVADLLTNIPAVDIDLDGNVSLRGSNGVRILIDGKPSGLVGSGNAEGLEGLQASMIQRIEVITNPSARYEAEGMAGIINIVLKKEQKKGINGAVDAKAGHPHFYNLGFNLNYRQQQFNFFANLNSGYRDYAANITLYQEIRENDTLFITDMLRRRARSGWRSTLRVGSDYYMNDENILTFAFSYRRNDNINTSNITYRDYLVNLQNPDIITVRDQVEDDQGVWSEYNLSYKKILPGKDHELTVDLRHQKSTEDEYSDYTDAFYNAQFEGIGWSDRLQRATNDEGETLNLLQFDYQRPLGTDHKLETGWRSTIRDIGNDYLIEQFDGSQWYSLDDLSNKFVYDETIHALYLMVNGKMDRFSYQAGLRSEYTDVKTQLIQTNVTNPRDYLNWFPSAAISYEWPNQQQLQLSFSRRLRRPSFRELNPFFGFSDNRNLFSGNPNLNPEYTNSAEMTYLRYFNKGSISVAAYVKHTDGVIDRIRTIEDGVSYTQLVNLTSWKIQGLELLYNFNPYKWWKIDGSVNAYHFTTDGSNFDNSFVADNYNYTFLLGSKTQIRKGTDLQINMRYRTPTQSPQGEYKGMYWMNLGVSQELLKNKATLTLSVQDVFNSVRYRYHYVGPDFYSQGVYRRRPRQITLAFNYRINQKKTRRASTSGGSDDRGDF